MEALGKEAGTSTEGFYIYSLQMMYEVSEEINQNLENKMHILLTESVQNQQGEKPGPPHRVSTSPSEICMKSVMQ